MLAITRAVDEMRGVLRQSGQSGGLLVLESNTDLGGNRIDRLILKPEPAIIHDGRPPLRPANGFAVFGQ